MKYNLEDLKEAFIELYDVDITKKHRRTTDVVSLLIVYANLAREVRFNREVLSLVKIGEFIKKNHSTITYYIRKYSELIRYDKALQTITEEILDYLKNKGKEVLINEYKDFNGYIVEVIVSRKNEFLGIKSVKSLEIE
jgi:hypothetical protein